MKSGTIVQGAKDDIYHQMLAELLVQIGSSEAFTQLRTVEQLGYIVFMITSRDCGVYSIRFMLQSNKFSAQHLEDRVEVFLGYLANHLKGNLKMELGLSGSWIP